MDIEIWMPIKGQEGLFEISDLGNVRSYKKKGRGSAINDTPKPIKPCMDGRGYLNFTIRINGRPRTLLIHREVAKAFKPNPHNHKIARHLNDIKTDNRAINIAWGTYADNRLDGIINKRHFHKKGERPAKAKLTSKQVLKIFNSSLNNCELARKYSVTESTISKIKLGRGWTNVTGLPYIK